MTERERLRAMTVAELRSKLAEFSDDTLVLVDGYEGELSGYAIRETKVCWAPTDAWYYGPYREDEDLGDPLDGVPDQPAIVLARD